MPDPNSAIIQLKNVTIAFGGHTVLHDINLAIRNQEFLTLLGPSGCGKTTMLRLIAGFEAPTRGRILIAGKDITDLPPNQRKVNTVFQSYALFPHMNVFDNVAFGLKMSRIAPDEVRSRVIAMLRMVALEEMAGRKPNQLSGGQQQRVAIARAAVNNPLVLLLDEPLSALDAKLRKQMQRELKHLQRRLGITFIHVTHDQQEALSVSDRVVVLQDGCIQQIGTPVEVYENPVSLKVAKFVGETNILDGEILGLEEQFKDGSVKALVEGQAKPCLLKTKEALSSGQRIKVMLRPEDLLVNRQKPAGDDTLWIEGQVDETIYKGTTYDIAITLTNGKQLLVTEFFDENDESMIAAAGERVFVSWIKGWEIVFIDEDAQSV
ncbi:MAG: spermidine/putrescine ABC transporter ATP-binding protein PotA [Pseudomonadota bacterium]